MINKLIPLLRNHLSVLPAYTPIEPYEVLSEKLNIPVKEIVKLDANENPYGPSPHALQALSKLNNAHVYPDPESRALRTALSSYTGVPTERLLAGSGADELIDLIIRVSLEPGETILNCPPTFGMYSFDAQMNAGQVIEVKRNSDFSLDLDLIEKIVVREKPKLLFLATPNNPDGSRLYKDTFNRLIALPVLVILDEAYIEFTSEGTRGTEKSFIDLIEKHNNLIVLRTFSKWAGLAGLRVGYGAFPDWIMPTLWKAKQPYNVNVAASAAAIASLENTDLLMERVNMIIAEKKRLLDAFQTIPFLQPYPSQANFILCRVLGLDASSLHLQLARDYGILVRYFNKPGLEDHIRISIGTPHQNNALLHALAAISESLESR